LQLPDLPLQIESGRLFVITHHSSIWIILAMAMAMVWRPRKRS
jgi:hypothetical protein